MKQAMIEKSVDSASIGTEQLAKIEQFTRRTMKAEELFVFSVILCDNEIDRDNERFSGQSLQKLAELFVGKTGVFDHMASAENQAARIFDAVVEKSSSKTSIGEEYLVLKAWAYMVRCTKNLDLILEIDAGIKKEVSVGCAVEQVVCSVCGSDQKAAGCEHIKGKSYGSVACHHLLENPIDAYEWSFVAVPAQKNAGVVKRYSESGKSVIEKLAGASDSVSLSKQEVEYIRARLDRLSQYATAGNEYMQELRKGVVRSASIAMPEMDCAVIEEICSSADLRQLKALSHGYESAAGKKTSAPMQFGDCTDDEQVYKGFGSEFRI